MVYLLHFERPISDTHTCQHYVGTADDVEERLAEHKAGRGARLCQVAKERGIDFVLVRTWEGGRAKERQIKKWKMSNRLCPICSER